MSSVRALRGIAVLSLGLGGISAAWSVVLYDASTLATPTTAPWSWLLGGAGAIVTAPSAGSHFTRLDSSAVNAAQEGWIQAAPFALDNSAGYDVTFDVRVNQEAHANNDRAGLSLIVLGQDHKGIELSFWTNKIWAQADSPLFTQAEGAAYDTTAAGSGVGSLRHYVLHVAGGNYALSAEGSSLFGGSIRDYSAFTGSPNPYSTPNFLWVGDDTGSAGASSDFSYYSVAPATPEPETLAALALGLVAFGRHRRSAKKTR